MLRHFLKHHRPKIIAIGYVLLTTGLAFAGLAKQYPGLPVVDYGIRTFQMFSFGGVGTPDASARSLNPGLLIARTLAAIFTVTAGAVVLRHLAGEQWIVMRLRFTRNHIIVCGLGTKGRQLVASLRAQGKKVAVIEHAAEVDGLTDARESGALILSGDATSESLLKRAGLARAAALVALCGSDRTNVEILMRTAAGRHPGHAALRCAVHLSSPRTRELLQQSDLFPRGGACEVRFFNVEEVSARGCC